MFLWRNKQNYSLITCITKCPPYLFYCMPAKSWHNLFEPWHDKTNKVTECQAKTQISLGIRPVSSKSSLSAWRKLGSIATHWVHCKDSDQTGQMPRLIWVFAGHTLISLVSSCRGSFMSFVNNGTDQPANPCSLISAFIVHYLNSIIPIFATCTCISEIPRLQPAEWVCPTRASLCSWAGLSWLLPQWSTSSEGKFAHAMVHKCQWTLLYLLIGGAFLIMSTC